MDKAPFDYAQGDVRVNVTLCRHTERSRSVRAKNIIRNEYVSIMKKLILFLFFLPQLAFSQSGTFSVALTTTDSIVYDTPGAFMSIHGTIYNLSSTDSVELSMEKQFIDILVTWETQILKMLKS